MPDPTAPFDARDWLAGLMGCDRGDLAVRSIDRYGPTETQVRYERGNEAVARVIVKGPIIPIGKKQGEGYWVVSAQIGYRAEGAHTIDIPEPTEILY